MKTSTGVVLAIVTVGAVGAAVDAHIRLADARQHAAAVEAALAVQPQPEHVLVPSTSVVTLPADVTNSALRAQFEQMQRQVAALASERDRLQSDLVAAQKNLADLEAEAAQPRPPRGGGTNDSRRVTFEARMAQLQRDDPARFAEMQKQREEFRQRMEKQANDRAEFLQQVDTEGMTETQRANHEQLVKLAADTRALMTQLPALPPEQADAARQQLGANMSALSDLYKQERVNLLVQTGVALGYTGDQAVQFAAGIQQIYDQTSMQGQGFGRGGRPGAAGRPGTAGAVNTTGGTATGGTTPVTPTPTTTTR